MMIAAITSSTLRTSSRAALVTDELEQYAPTEFAQVPGMPESEAAPQMLGHHYEDAPPRGALIPYQTHRRGFYNITPGFFEHLPVTFDGRPLREMPEQRWTPGTQAWCVCQVLWESATFTAPINGEVDAPSGQWYYRTGGSQILDAVITVIPPGGSPPPTFSSGDLITLDPEAYTQPHVYAFPLGIIEEDGSVDFSLSQNGNIIAVDAFLVVNRPTYPD